MASFYRGKPVNRSLQNIGGGHLVNHLTAPFAADVCGDQVACDGLRAPTLVPQQYRQAEGAQILGKGFRGLSLFALASVQIERQANDNARHKLFCNDRFDSFKILGKLPPFDRFGCRRDHPLGIAQRHPDGFGANIKPKQPATIGQGAEKRFAILCY